jgi:hypothetical protein
VKAKADSVRLLRRADVLACLEPVEVIEAVRGATEATARGDAATERSLGSGPR